MGGIAGGKPGTTYAVGSYNVWAKYSTSLRPATRVLARMATPARSGNRSAPVLPIVWQVRQMPLPSMIDRPTLAMSVGVMSSLRVVSVGGCTSF